MRKTLSFSFLVLAFFLLGSCQSGLLRNGNGNATTSDLSRTEAELRSQHLRQIKYNLSLDLMGAQAPAADATFEGDLTVRFDWEGPVENLRMEFFEGEILTLELNDTKLNSKDRLPYALDFPAQLIRVGSNTLHIVYRQKYSHSGEGLHRFQDPEDHEYYLYTNFEPFDANKFMPCFDQPDLRSQLTLHVRAPLSWKVVSSVREYSMLPIGGNANQWEFPASPEISTYLFSLYAGPYQEFTDSFVGADNHRIPLRLLVRKTLARYLNPDDRFQITKQGLKFYEDYFHTPYPFQKLDQIYVPEFNEGGMENAAAIAYTEWDLPRSQPTREMRRMTAELFLHEIAHMWFGDLVTMKWWNDLWLNESFATYMSHLAMERGTEFHEAWQMFAAQTKRGAYAQDAMSTTHPIEATINHTKEANANFDGITYNKGASVLKQLSYHITEDSFRKGLSDYFQSFSWKNTSLADFMGSLQKFTSQDLQLWSQRWLKQSGTDEVSASWKCEGNRLKALHLSLQMAPGREFRPQSLEVGLYQQGQKGFVSNKHLRAEFNTNSELDLKGNWPCPAFVSVNDNDHDFVKVRLDPVSQLALNKHLSEVQDPLTRSLLWSEFWRMVRETQIPLKDYVALVSAHFPQEKNEVIRKQIVATLTGTRSALYYWPRDNSGQLGRTAFVKQMESLFLRNLRESPSGSDEEKFWFDNLVEIAESPQIVDQFSVWLKAPVLSRKFKLDLDRQWALVRTLARHDSPLAKDFTEELIKADSSDRGHKAALSVQASAPDFATKKNWIDRVTQVPSELNLQDSESVLWSLFPIEQEPLKTRFENTFYEYFEQNRKSEDVTRAQAVLQALLPLVCESVPADRLRTKLSNPDQVDPSLLKSLRMRLDEDERCQRIRAGSQL